MKRSTTSFLFRTFAGAFLLFNAALAQDLAITSRTPDANQVDAPASSDIRVAFNRPISAESVNSQTLRVFGEKSGAVKGTVTLSADQMTAVFTPDRPFLPGEKVTVVLTKQPARAEALLKKGCAWEFFIKPENGSTRFLAASYPFDLQITSIAAADLDGDGVADLALTGRRGGVDLLKTVYFRNGRWLTGDSLQLPDRVRPLCTGDLNRDGRPDLVLLHRGRTRYSLPPRMSICLVQPDGRLQLTQTILLAYTQTGFAEPRGAAISDFNNDGFLDIAVGVRNDAQRAGLIYLNDGTGTFPTQAADVKGFDKSKTAESIFSTDLNRSGFIDIGIGHSENPGLLDVFINDENLTLKPVRGLSDGESDLENCAAFDLTGDGFPDLMALDYTYSRLMISKYTGWETDGQLKLPLYRSSVNSYPTLTRPNSIDFGDFDADGDIDAAVSGSGNAFIQVLWNEEAAFRQSQQENVPGGAVRCVTADLNGDGALDIVVADTTGTVTVLFNGAGFQPPQAPVLLEPADGAFTLEHRPTFRWQTPADPNADDSLYFRITLQLPNGIRVYDQRTSPSGFSTAGPVPQGQGEVAFTPPEPLPEGAISWFVEADDGLLVGPPSAVRRLTIDDGPPVLQRIELPQAVFNGKWIAHAADEPLTLRVFYREAHPARAVLSSVLGGPFEFTSIPGGEHTVDLSFSPLPLPDGEYPITVELIDSLGQSATLTISAGIDRRPPSGTLARVDAPVSRTRTFRVYWGGGSDGGGSGLAGQYRVQVRVNNGPWNVWIPKTSRSDSLFTGENLTLYEFEAASFDNVGRVEEFSGTPEASVYVNRFADDHTPPPPPVNLRAGGANPSPWQAAAQFTVQWNLPFDESGIFASFWKLGAPPVSADDYSASGPPQGPAIVALNADGVVPLYVWLSDSAGNVDYRRSASIFLRRDSGVPVVHSLAVESPAPSGTDAAQIQWFNTRTAEQLSVALSYSEPRPLRAVLTTDGLSDSLVNRGAALGSGDPKRSLFTLATAGAASRTYNLRATVVDSAENKSSRTLRIGLDGHPPTGAMAQSPVVSPTDTFTVSWTAGSDGSGSGIVRYDLYSKTEDGEWRLFHSAAAAGKVTFKGENGRTYYFDCRAVDLVGLSEAPVSAGECSTRVDFSAGDRQAPPAPINLRANGAAPASPWSRNPLFNITWQNPADPSGIVKALWKLGAPPTAPADTTGSGPGRGPLSVRAADVGKHPLYVWLMDGAGNSDHRSAGMVLLRFDDRPPVVSETRFLNAAYGADWYNPRIDTAVSFQLTYQEPFPDSLIVSSDALGFSFRTTDLVSGSNVRKQIPFSIAGKPDGAALIRVTLSDSAGNRATVFDTLRIDSTPSYGAAASSPPVSAALQFTVSWTKGNDDGVGVVDLYDVIVQVNQGQWTPWLQDYRGRSAVFSGENGKRYGFEVLSRDLLGNKERQLFQAESVTLVNTAAADSIAPAAPMNLRAGGASPSPWQNQPDFIVTWTNPPDSSGIARAFYKLGSAPTANHDTSGTTFPQPPVTIRTARANGEMLYVWLQDGAGNVDYRRHAAVMLRYDYTPPIIDSLVLADPRPVDGRWYNPRVPPQRATLRVYARDARLANIRLTPTGLFPAAEVPAAAAPPSASFVLSFPNFEDAQIDLQVTVFDSAGNSAQGSLPFALDGTPPRNTIAQSPDTTAPGDFIVSWDVNRISETGSGLSGIYSLRIKIDDQPWTVWNAQYEGTSAVINGKAGSRYAFEAAAYDRTGNWEGFTGVPESITYVSSGFVDTEPPAAPADVTVNGYERPRWSAVPEFTVDWLSPVDRSGIAKVFYKFYQPPASAEDFSGSGSGNPPLKVRAPAEGRIPLYIWLQDGAGNANPTNAAVTELLYDVTPPRIVRSEWLNAQYAGRWFHPDSVGEARLHISFDEEHADSLRLLWDTPAATPKVFSPLPSGSNRAVETAFSTADLTEGRRQLTIVLSDSAGNKAVDTLSVGLDSTPPRGTVAISPAQNTTGRFTVTWSGGDDGDGSGLSGEYDLRMSINDGPWFDVVTRTRTTSYTYVGTHGNRFSFEAAAWDNVGNREPLIGVAETTTVVDTSFADITPPAAPIAVNVAGKNPSPWQNSPEFVVEWQHPPDPSSIAAAYYKLGAPPQHDADADDSTVVDPQVGRLIVRVNGEGEHTLWLWLKDGRGNRSRLNAAAVRLRYDSTPPRIGTPFTVGHRLLPGWFNPTVTPEVLIKCHYSELHPDSFFVWNAQLGRFGLQAASGDTLTARLNFSRAADGAYRLYMALQDSAGNRSAVDSVDVFIDRKPPRLSAVADTLVEPAVAPQVFAAASDENLLTAVELYYRQGGRRQYERLPMTAENDSLFVAQIPAEAVTDRGLDWYVVAADGVNQVRYPAETTRSSVGMQVRLSNGLQMPQPLPAGGQETAYRMVAFPIEMDQPLPKVVLEDDLGPYDPTRWRMFIWDPLGDAYREFDQISALEPGRAYWIITSQEGKIIDSGPGKTVNTAKPFTMLLKKGWNDVSVPYTFPVDWRDIVSASAVDTQKVQGPHAYIGRWQYPFENQILLPWQGYSVYSELDDFLLTIPALEAASPLAKKSLFSGVDWVVQIIAVCGKSRDSANFFGSAKQATEGRDAGLDFVEAPGVGSFVSLYFPHSDWPMHAERFTSDFRPFKSGAVWDFEVECPAQGDIKLTFQPTLKPPASLTLRMVDAAAGISVDMLADSTYTFHLGSNETVRRFRLFAGDDRFMEEHQDELPPLPKGTALLTNYPNPFNSTTMISFSLQEEIEVELAVYNLLAQKVKHLRSGRLEKGFYQIAWDGRDDWGRELGTGVYILRLETPTFSETRKMVYIR